MGCGGCRGQLCGWLASGAICVFCNAGVPDRPGLDTEDMAPSRGTRAPAGAECSFRLSTCRAWLTWVYWATCGCHAYASCH